MKAIMVMFDSLNRHYLPPYGCDWVHAPNFTRLSQRATTFDTSYVCSMPCMPARRDLHTGRPNFLHRSWGPLEPFDDSVPQILKENGVYSHLTSDHYHYWEDGGATYHPRYSSWEFFRGQEGDPWVGQVQDPEFPLGALGRHAKRDNPPRQDLINREQFQTEADLPQVKTFSSGLEFIERNADADNWFLQIETFDPHEPFFALPEHRALYDFPEGEPLFDWPVYEEATHADADTERIRRAYASLVSLCDAQLGRVLDAMDEHNLWQDTLLIVWTDHGFCLGERGWWGKMKMPWWKELARTPFWIHDPRTPRPGERRQSLVQPSIDLGPTLLRFFGLEPTPDMLGHDLAPVVEDDAPVREAAIFGQFGAPVNVTDGRYVYMRSSLEDAKFPPQFTLMTTTMRDRLSPGALKNVSLHPGFGFSKGCALLQINKIKFGYLPELAPPQLFDLQTDPKQEQHLEHPEIEARMTAHMERLMRQCDAPPEQFQRLGLTP